MLVSFFFFLFFFKSYNTNTNKKKRKEESPTCQQQQQEEQPYLYVTGQVALSDQNEEIFLASSSDNGDTFSELTSNLSNNSEFSECPSIATSENNIYVIWQDRTPGNNEVFFTKAKV